MLQYLVNTTCIWALGYIIYAALLRNETFHAFNRAYLSGVLTAGIIIPFLTWQIQFLLPATDAATTPGSNIAYNYIEQSTTIKQKVVTVIQPAKTITIESILWIIYLAGAIVTLALLVMDIVRMIQLYRNGNKVKRNGYTLVESGKDISPCSAFGCVFISVEDNYTPGELDLVLSHELRHIQLRHSIDLLWLQLLQVVFWFHPLIYLYKRSLKMVHEYQADKIALQTGNNYGIFLIEQAMLPSAPVISHSFAHSPLKNRIVMMTKKSARTAQAKMLVVIPLAIVCILAFSNCKNDTLSPVVNKPEKNGNIGKYKGNVIKLAVRKPDTTIAYEHETGKPDTIISYWADRPLTLNGKTIHTVYTLAYGDDIDIDTEPTYPSGPTLGDYLFTKLKADFETLEDGRYNIILHNIVIDEAGEIAFYEYDGIQKVGTVAGPDNNMVPALDSKVIAIMSNAPAYTPAKIDNKPVPCRVGRLFQNGDAIINGNFPTVLVKNHKASIYTQPSES